MVKSLSQKKIFNKSQIRNKTNKKIIRSKSAIFTVQKKVSKLNSYRDCDKILNFIDSSNKNSQSKIYKEHFLNIQMTKDIDTHKKNLMKKNEIYLK